jgi:hypothetical protein
MQSSRSDPNKGETNDSQISKPVMFVLVVAAISGVVLPILSPHFLHPSVLFHVVLHLASLSIASFLALISIQAYLRVKNFRLFFMMLGFLSLAAVETVHLLESSGMISMMFIEQLLVDIELPHVMLLIMLCLFGAGVVRVTK